MDRTFRQFRILEPIGKGTTGSIYRGVQTTLDRPVAIKELHPHLSADPDFIARFEREAKTAATLQHENIVSVIDFGREMDRFYIALEFVDGSDVDALIDQHVKIPLPVALTLMNDMLRGLEHAHRHGVVHRDVKPANVLLSKHGTAKIADFSIAHAATQPSMTMTGATLGTPAYMSPEQVGGRPVDARTDLFSAVVMFYEMVTGKRPFAGDSYPSIIGQLLTVTPELLSKVDPAIPESIARVVRRGLEKDRDRRYPDAAELARAFESAARAEKIPHGRDLIAAFMVSAAEYEKVLAARPTVTGGTFQRLQVADALRELEAEAKRDPGNVELRRRIVELGGVPPAARSRSVPGGKALLVLAPLAISVAAFFGVRAMRGAGSDALVAETPNAATAVVAAATTTATPTTASGTAATPADVAVATATATATAVPEPTAVTAKTATARATRTPVARVTATGTPRPTEVAMVGATPSQRIPPAATPTAAPLATAAIRPTTPAPTPAAQAAVPRGMVKVRVNPGSLEAKIYADGKLVGETPMNALFELPAGPHTIVVSHPQYRVSSTKIVVKAGETYEHKIKLEVP